MTRDLTHGEAQDILETMKRGWEGRDVDLVMSLFSDDAEYRADPFEEALRGANAIRGYWNEAVAGQAHVEFDAERTWVSGRTVLSSWHVAFTRRANAERVRIRGFMTLEVNDEGRVWRFREWWHRRVVGVDSTFRPEGPAAERSERRPESGFTGA